MSSYNSSTIAENMLSAIVALSPDIRELLFQSKSEQTFSALLAEALNKEKKIIGSRFLVEIKGELSKSANGSKSLNSHDVALVDQAGNIKLTIENKVWYHFDGAKGVAGVLNPNVKEQLAGDIAKTKATQNTNVNQGFILICIVTPATFTKYQSSHNTALKQAEANFAIYKERSIRGFKSHLSAQSSFKNMTHLEYQESETDPSQGMADIFCAEI